MNTPTRTPLLAIGSLVIANTLGVGAASAQTASASAAAVPAQKTDPRFIVKPGTPDIRDVDPKLVIGPVTVTGCPLLLLTGCSNSPATLEGVMPQLFLVTPKLGVQPPLPDIPRDPTRFDR